MDTNNLKKIPKRGFFESINALRDIFGTLTAAPQTHPEIFITGIAGLKQLYVINHPALAQHVLQKNYTNYSKAAGYEVLALLLGKGLLTNEGDNWHKQRTLIQPAFHRDTLKKIGQIVVASTNQMLVEWKEKEGQQINLTKEMAGLTIDIVARSLFTADIAPQQIQTIWKNVNFLNEAADKMLRSPLALPYSVPTPLHIKMRKAIGELNDIVYEIINKRIHEKNPPLDLLQLLLECRYENTGEGMDKEQIRDEVMTIFLAGHETTVNALSWTWFLLKQNENAEHLLKKESLGIALNGQLGFEDTQKMPYGKNVVNESMRMYPPVPIVGRLALNDDIVGNYKLPKGAEVGINITGIHHHADYWEEPYAFKPERFDNFDLKGANRFVFLPFGGGPRICIGNNFAMMEMQLINAMIAAHVEMELVEKNVTPIALITLKPGNGVIVKLHKVTPAKSSHGGVLAT